MGIPLRSIYYQWESLLYREDLSTKQDYEQKFGYKVLTRKDGKADKVQFFFYLNNDTQAYITGSFCNWKNNIPLTNHHNGFHSVILDTIKHKDSYLLVINDAFYRDPAATYFDEKGNCVFWDYDDPSTYKKKFDNPDTLHRSTKILQTDLPGLVSRWYEYDSTQPTLAESDKDVFTYIRTCGVLQLIKELGFNTIQFLPVNQSIDGDNWKFRYLVTYHFALQKNWGNPDSYMQLVDACHQLGIAVITDIVLSHCPFKDFKIFGMRGEDVGIHVFNDNNNQCVYLDEHTPWGTKRFRYGDENVRRFLIESGLHQIKQYGIDGFRIDNVDGILRYGEAGDGDERPHGRLFLREFTNSIYELKPLALIHLESHYFYGDNAKMLVAPLTSDTRALGATAYNSSRLTYYFHREFMPKAVEQISVWRFEHIREEKEWGRSNSTIADFHNHDAAAGLMAERATGSYAYDALILKRPELHVHAVGKILVMESIIALGCEGRMLDLMQTFLLQKGTFEHDSSIHWSLLNNPESKKTVEFKKKINHLVDHPAFWPENTLYRNYVNVDEINKMLAIKRVDKTQNTKDVFYVVINLSSEHLNEYAIGVTEPGMYEVVLDNYNPPSTLQSHKSNRFEHFSLEIQLTDIAPYNIRVLKYVNNKQKS